MPEKMHHLRTSERGTFKRCQWRWWHSYRLGLKNREENIKLWFGTGIHLCLARYYGNPGYKRNMDYIDLWREYAQDSSGDKLKVDDDKFIEIAELGEIMLKEYHNEYGGDPHWDVIAVEESFQHLLDHWPASKHIAGTEGDIRNSAEQFSYDGTWDGVYRDKMTKRIVLMEHKTAAGISARHLTLDDQAGAYWAIAQKVLKERGVLKRTQSLHGINYNFLRKATPDVRPINADGYRTNKPKKEHYLQALAHLPGVYKSMTMPVLQEMADAEGITVLGEMSLSQPPPLFERHFVKRTKEEQQTQIDRIRKEEFQMDLVRSGIMPMTKTPTKDCSWDCDFFDLCELDERRADTKEFIKIGYRRADPYADHRKSAG